jgi:hypothetical protein
MKTVARARCCGAGLALAALARLGVAVAKSPAAPRGRAVTVFENLRLLC